MSINPFSSFYNKLVIALFTSFVLVSVLLMVLMNHLSASYQNEVEQKLHKQLAQHMVTENQLLNAGELDHVALKHAFHNMMVLGPAFEFYIVSPEGELETYSAEPGKVKRKQINLEPIHAFIHNSAKLPILGDDPRSLSRQKIFSVAEIKEQGALIAYLYIIIGGEKYDDIVEVIKGSHIITQGFWGVIASLSFMLVTLVLIFRMLTKPLRKLSEDMTTFRLSGFKTDYDSIAKQLHNWNETGDEIHQLGFTFTNMAGEMQRQYEKVKSTDEVRKELVSYVSHDLRTPLAALLGYLETWQLSKQSLSDEEKDKLVAVAIDNGLHIKKLVEQLFELARLDSAQVTLNKERISLMELCFDTIEYLKILAQEKGITIDVSCSENELYLVDVDVEKLSRVLMNLVDNAIQYCSQDDSVKIELLKLPHNEKHHTVRLSVIDTGKGIEANDLPFIFDAYYRSGKANKSKKGNSGLGLAISKRIIDLHGSKISVESEVGKGTCFSFEL